MGANSFGQRFVITSFGESHGPAIGVVIDGCPAGVSFDPDLLQHQLHRRRPGQHQSLTPVLHSSRQEDDQVQILSGLFEGKTLGTPIACVVPNKNQKSQDYEQLKNSPRKGHADQVWKEKFHHFDHRGGGRSSGRETLSRVIGGAIAQMLLQQVHPSTQVIAFAEQIGPLCLNAEEINGSWNSTNEIDAFSARFPSREKSKDIENLLIQAKKEGKSYGGVVRLKVLNPPPSLGQPVFHKLKADFTSAFMSIGATSGVELGDGFSAAHQEGSQFHKKAKSPYGGIQGGLSTGDAIEFRIAFKPTSSVLEVARQGRHDPCIVPRAIPVLEAMAYMVLADHWLWSQTDRVESSRS